MLKKRYFIIYLLIITLIIVGVLLGMIISQIYSDRKEKQELKSRIEYLTEQLNKRISPDMMSYVEFMDWLIENLRRGLERESLLPVSDILTTLQNKAKQMEDSTLIRMANRASYYPDTEFILADDWMQMANYVLEVLERAFGSTIREELDVDINEEDMMKFK